MTEAVLLWRKIPLVDLFRIRDILLCLGCSSPVEHQPGPVPMESPTLPFYLLRAANW